MVGNKVKGLAAIAVVLLAASSADAYFWRLWPFYPRYAYYPGWASPCVPYAYMPYPYMPPMMPPYMNPSAYGNPAGPQMAKAAPAPASTSKEPPLSDPVTKEPAAKEPGPKAPVIIESRSQLGQYAEPVNLNPSVICKVGFWNLSGKDVHVAIGGKKYLLANERGLTLDLPRQFTWQMNAGEPRREDVPAARTIHDIVIKE